MPALCTVAAQVVGKNPDIVALASRSAARLRLTNWETIDLQAPEAPAMALTLYLHPLSSYCHKVLIALYENQTPFKSR